MGCSGSAHMVPATSDIALKPTNGPSNNAEPEKGDIVLKDLPDVVEKVIGSLKATDLHNLQETASNVENTIVSGIKEGITTASGNVAKQIQDTSNKVTTTAQGVLHGLGIDSVSTSSKISEVDEENIKAKIKSSPTISTTDIDSLRTSSPESEIEQALANNNDQNPPTPKPTFSELQNLVVLPVNTVLKSSIKTSENVIGQIGDKNPVIDSLDKLDESIIIITRPKDATEWEKQADLLALAQKYNPIESMRKFRRDNNGGERNGNGLNLKNEFKPKFQNFFEDLNEFMPIQSPLRSRISSAKSDTNLHSKELTTSSSEFQDNGQGPLFVLTKDEREDDHQKHKTKETKFKRTPERRIKDSNLLAPANVRGIPTTPSPHRVRAGCSVCCNKYKALET